MPPIPVKLDDPLEAALKTGLEHDLNVVEEKIKSELRCVYDLEIFDIVDAVESTKAKASSLYKAISALYTSKKELMGVISAQLGALEALQEAEELASEDAKELAEVAKDILEDCGKHAPPQTDNELAFKEPPEQKEEREEDDREFIPVTEAQYESVPALVKRRAKLEHINELLRYLHNHAVKRNRCVPVKLTDIDRDGIKVYGQTGMSKIAALRYLKMLEVSNRYGGVTRRDNTVRLLDPRFGGGRKRPKK